jgi:hypothetical protein
MFDYGRMPGEWHMLEDDWGRAEVSDRGAAEFSGARLDARPRGARRRR